MPHRRRWRRHTRHRQAMANDGIRHRRVRQGGAILRVLAWRFRALLTGVSAGLLVGCAGGAPQIARPDAPDTSAQQVLAVAKSRPNVLLIVADDLGYSDLGVLGSEMNTPNLDALAADGLLMTSFYGGGHGPATRAMLMTGQTPHQAGFGATAATLVNAPELAGRPAYKGQLSGDRALLPQRLQRAGYETFMAGRWDFGTQSANLPLQRGFDRAFALLDEGASRFSDGRGISAKQPQARYLEDHRPVQSLPAGYYSSEYFTDRMIGYIRESRDRKGPFFGYLAYTAPHYPLQAPYEWRNRARGRYDLGWDVMRGQRLARQQALGLVTAQAQPARPLSDAPAWVALSPQARERAVRNMEIYAAMVENLDHQVGRLVAYLRETGELANTLIVFLSDNGPEGNDVAAIQGHGWVATAFDNQQQNIGREGSFGSLDAGWAQASATPLSMYKSYAADGGLRVPAIVHFPALLPYAGISDELTSAVDLLPTILELTGAGSARARAGMPGRSLAAHLADGNVRVRGADEALAFEVFGGRALRQGRWKITWLWPPHGQGRWALYDLHSDPGEREDLASRFPQRLARMARAWDGYAKQQGIKKLDRDIGLGRRDQPAAE